MRRSTLRVLAPFVLSWSACLTPPLPLDRDAGAERPDAAGALCAYVHDQVSAWLAAHRDCTTDDDCTSLSTACSLEGACGTFANVHVTEDDTLSWLLTAWTVFDCGVPCGCTASVPPPPGCNANVCGPRRPGSLGDGCRGDADCLGGCCLVEAAFPGGYCSADCSSASCPPAGVCRPIADGRYCLQPCDPRRSDQCRPGLLCCGGGPGPGATPPVCVPPSSIYCLGV